MSLGKARLLRSIVFSSLAIAYPTLAPAKENSVDLATLEKQCIEADTADKCRIALPICAKSEATLGRTNFPNNQIVRLTNVLTKYYTCQFRLGNYKQAENLAQKSLHLRQHYYGNIHLDVAENQHDLAVFLVYMEKYDEAERLITRSIETRKRLLNNNEVLIAESVGVLGMVYHRMGRFAEAESLYRKSIELCRLSTSPQYESIAVGLSNLGTLLRCQGKYEDAEHAYLESINVAKNITNSQGFSLAITQGNLANVIGLQGRYIEAEKVYRHALEMAILSLGHQHPEIASIMINLANNLADQGETIEAESLHRRALDARIHAWGYYSSYVASSLSSLGLVLEQAGKFSEAEGCYREAVDISRKSLTQNHPYVSIYLHNLSKVLYRQKKYKEAENSLLLSMEILKLHQKSDGTQMGHAVALLALIMEAQGKREEAGTLHQQGIQIRGRNLGLMHPSVAASMRNLVLHRFGADNLKESVALLMKTSAIEESVVRTIVSEARMRSYLYSIRPSEEILYSILLQEIDQLEIQRFSLSLLLLRKGRSIDSGVSANRLIHRSESNESIKRKTLDLLSSLRRREELLRKGPSGSMSEESFQSRLSELQVVSDSLEAQLAQALPELQNLQPPHFEEISPAVAKQIPKDGVLVEVVTARPFQAKTDEPDKRWGSPRFVALLLFPDQKIVSVDLGLVEDMDQAGRALLAGLRSPKSNPVAAAQAMYQRVFAPLTPHLIGKKEVFLSPDGSLHMIPFDALHDGTDYLLGRYRFHYLTSGRDLLRQPSQRTPGQPLIIGDPDVGPSDAASRPQNQTIYNIPSDLTPLRGARKEAVFIGKQSGVTPLLGIDAREEIIHQAKGPLFLHIPTHGFFPTGGVLPVPEDVRSSLLPLLSKPDPKSQGLIAPDSLPGEVDAMNRGALVLAGARQGHLAKSTDDDGLLTAQEVRLLDLDGTELVTLPACDSGQGFISNGQGVYGLRRAFLIAGAETVVSSLWRIDDDATGALMQRYYAKLLDPFKPGDRLGSMIESMQELRAAPKWSHPYYWAPFLVIGRDGPLRWP